jgi:periplasmic protein TonB
MKPILTAGLLALIIHGILFSLDFNWPGSLSLKNPIPRVLSMTLAQINGNPAPNHAPKIEPVLKQKAMDQKSEKPVLKTQTMAPKIKKPIVKQTKAAKKKKAPVLKKRTMLKKSKERPNRAKHISLKKASPTKPVQVPLQPKTEKASKIIAEYTGETKASDLELKKHGEKTVSKFVEYDGASLSPLETIHEAKPAYRSNPSPKYPRIARIRGYQGNVLLDVLVKADGKVDDVKIFKSSGYPVLDRSARSTVKKWLFEPGRIGKRKVDMWVRVPIRFELME